MCGSQLGDVKFTDDLFGSQSPEHRSHSQRSAGHFSTIVKRLCRKLPLQ